MTRAASVVAVLALTACDRTGASLDPLKPIAAAPAAARRTAVEPAALDPAAAAELEKLEAIVRAAPGDHPAADRYREAARTHGAVKRAIALFEQLAADGRAGREANVHVQLGMAYVDSMEQTPGLAKPALAGRALAAFDAAIARDPALWDARYARGLVFLRMPASLKQFPKAIDAFSELLEWQTRQPQQQEFALTYYRLSEAHVQAGDHEQAAAVLRSGLRRFPDHALLRRRLEVVGAEAREP